ncbi:MAG TPA: hypothetical protein VK395_07135 [Gemmataceae bacterium]|nr:hypothetical protein [Gemmataceae bacterium]
MIGWREKAKRFRAGQGRRQVAGRVATPVAAGLPDQLGQQVTFAKRIAKEVLVPVLREFASIVTGAPAPVQYHEYDERTIGVTCDLNSSRFTAKVYFLPAAAIRLSVILTPSQTEAHCRDFAITAPNNTIEEWFGNCLTKLYENR